MILAGKKQQGSTRKAASPAKVRAERNMRGMEAAPQQEGFIDARTRRDIGGVVFIIIGVALYAMMTIPTNAVVASALSEFLHLGFGKGAYVFPFVLVLIGISFIIRFQDERVPARVAVGLFIMFVAILGILGLYTPGVDVGSTNYLFLRQNLLDQGGYVGAGIAWVGVRFLGVAVSAIVLVGLIVIALMVIGFSINGIVTRLREVRERKRENAQEAAGEDEPVTSGGKPRRKKRERPSIAGFDDMPRRVAEHTTHMKEALAGNSSRVTRLAAENDDVLDAEILPADDVKTRRLSPSSASQTTASDTLTRKLGTEQGAPKRKKAPSGQGSASTTGATGQASSRGATGGSLAYPQATEGFVLPDMSLLRTSSKSERMRESDDILRETATLLQNTLEDFGVPVEVVGWVAGPTVTLFKINLPSGIRVNRITNLTDDIALALAAPGVRIFAPIPGTNYVGVEVPNKVRRNVYLGDVLPAAKPGPLQVAVGEDVEGHKMVFDLAKMPHLLVGGTTGSGKSIAINSMIMSILMRATPDEVRFIMVDPKRVEFAPYNGIPHLYVPVVTEPREAASALAWGAAEMERRLKVFSKVGARDIGQYNTKVHQGLLDEEGADPARQMPYIVIVIDELADLMMNVGKDVEFSISRIAQLARAAGIHMIVATQRPSTNVVTGLIKANITNRMALTVASGIDSRVILDSTGAENLIGNGDMLFGKPEFAKPVRLQGCFVSPEEIEAVVTCLKEQGEPDYHTDILKTNLMSIGTPVSGSNGSAANEDPLLWDAAELVVSAKSASTSNIQRHFSIGYSRAGRIMDMLEEKGVVGPSKGSKPRDVLIDELELESLKAFEAND